MTDTELLRSIIKEKGLKFGFIAKKLGLSAYGFQKKVQNQNEFKVKEVDALCKILGIEDVNLKEAIFFAKEDDYKSPTGGKQ